MPDLLPAQEEVVVETDASREKLLRAAAELFRQRGYGDTSMRDIAKIVGIKAGSIYYHFSSKEEMLDIILQRGISAFEKATLQALEQLGSTASFRDRLHALIAVYLRLRSRVADTAIPMRSFIHEVSPDMRGRYSEATGRYNEIWHQIIREGIGIGDVRDDLSPPLIRMLLMGGLNMLADPPEPLEQSTEGIDALIADLFGRGLSPGAEKR